MAPRSKLVVEMTAEDAKLFTSMQKQAAAQKDLEKGYGKIGRASDRAGKQAQESFGNKQINNLQRIAVSMASITTAIQLAGQAMRFYKSETDSAVQSTKDLQATRARLVQVARSAQDLQSLESRADRIALDTGVTRDVARQLVFADRSTPLDAEAFARLRPVFQDQTTQVATSAAKVSKTFEGQVTAIQAANIASQAAEESAFTTEELLQRAPIAAAGGQTAGASVEETFAALAQLGSTQGLERASTLLQGFGVRLGLSEQFGGQGFVGGVQSLQAASEEDRRKFLGESQELNIAFQELAKILSTVTEESRKGADALERAGTEESNLQRRRQIALDPRFEYGRTQLGIQRLNISETQRQIQTERDLAERGLGQQAAINEAVAGARAANLGGFSELGAQTLGDAAASVQAGEDATAAAAGAGSLLGGGGTGAGGRTGTDLGGGATQSALQLLQRIANATERSSGQTRTLEAPDVD